MSGVGKELYRGNDMRLAVTVKTHAGAVVTDATVTYQLRNLDNSVVTVGTFTHEGVGVYAAGISDTLSLVDDTPYLIVIKITASSGQAELTRRVVARRRDV